MLALYTPTLLAVTVVGLPAEQVTATEAPANAAPVAAVPVRFSAAGVAEPPPPPQAYRMQAAEIAVSDVNKCLFMICFRKVV
jgi:hypothetical protein